MTDNFSQGFVNALRVETTDNTRIAGESAERVNEDVMILNNGVLYGLPSLRRASRQAATLAGQGRARHSGRQEPDGSIGEGSFRAVRQADRLSSVPHRSRHRVKRKSGFLFPQMSITDKLGFGIGVPYYQVLGDSADLTVTPTFYTARVFCFTVNCATVSRWERTR